jgi:hypothetical protein
MAVDIVVPLLVLAGSAAAIALAIAFRAKPRAVPHVVSVVTASPTGPSDATLIDPPRQFSESTSIVSAPASGGEIMISDTTPADEAPSTASAEMQAQTYNGLSAAEGTVPQVAVSTEQGAQSTVTESKQARRRTRSSSAGRRTTGRRAR